MKDILKGINDLYTKQTVLQAIWMDRPIVTSDKRTVRIEANMLVRIDNGELTDVTEDKPANYKILACYGTLINQFEITVINLDNNIPEQIKL